MWQKPVSRLTLKIDDTTLDCVRFGRGGRPLVLIPGLSFQGVRSAAFFLAYLYRIFAKEYTVFVFDKKAAVREGETIRDMAGDLAEAMKQLRLESAGVFGVSQGGMIAQYLAIDHPNLVDKLVLGVTASRTNEVMETVINGWIDMAEQRDYGAFVLDMFERMYSAAYLKKYRPLLPVLSKVGKPKDFSRFLALAKACLTCNSYPELAKISCPVFVIGGKQDRVVTGQASEEIAAQLHCKLHMYDGLGHAAYEEAPDFNEKILQFLKD